MNYLFRDPVGGVLTDRLDIVPATGNQAVALQITADEVLLLAARVAELEAELETQHNAAYEMIHSLLERR